MDIGDVAIRSIAENCSSLHTLEISGNHKITHQGLHMLADALNGVCKNLRFITCNHMIINHALYSQFMSKGCHINSNRADDVDENEDELDEYVPFGPLPQLPPMLDDWVDAGDDDHNDHNDDDAHDDYSAQNFHPMNPNGDVYRFAIGTRVYCSTVDASGQLQWTPGVVVAYNHFYLW